MNVSKINMTNPVSFRAQTTIEASESMLNKEDKAYLESIGKKIGNDTDTIKFTVGDLHANKMNPDLKGYTVTKSYKIANLIEQSLKTIPFIKNGEIIEKNSPKNYIEQALKKLMQIK